MLLDAVPELIFCGYKRSKRSPSPCTASVHMYVHEPVTGLHKGAVLAHQPNSQPYKRQIISCVDNSNPNLLYAHDHCNSLGTSVTERLRGLSRVDTWQDCMTCCMLTWNASVRHICHTYLVFSQHVFVRQKALPLHL